MRATLLISFCLISMIVADQLYFMQQRQEYDGGTVSEAFLRKGTLGKLLKENGLLSVSANSAKLASNGLCASDDEISGFDYHNTLRLRLRITPKKMQNVDVKILMPNAVDKRLQEQVNEVFLIPEETNYVIPFIGETGSRFSVEITSDDRADAIVEAVIIDGRFSRSLPLLEDGKLMDDLLFSSGALIDAGQANSQISNGSRFSLDQSTQRISFTFPEGIPQTLFSGVFPGKKNHGYCSYQASPITYAKENDQQLILPKIDLEVLPEFLTGPDGLFLNKELKGRHSEVPASVAAVTNEGAFKQAIGLRFHGGVPGRRKEIYSFRIYARSDYGKNTLPASVFLSKPREKGIKSLVFKYTYQAYSYDVGQEFNVFNHVFALDIGEQIGALVPSHNLVDLSINGETLGMYLAMEHISDRSIEHWLGHDDFVTVTYKKESISAARAQIGGKVMRNILNTDGEAAYDKLQQFYDVNNVINSIILTAYTGDNDYCQGTEVFDFKTDSMASFNWDLDHAFLRRNIASNKLEFGNEDLGFHMLLRGQSGCSRSKVYSWVYSQSARFRQAFRERFDYLVENQLSPKSLSIFLDRYNTINEQYYDGSQTLPIQQLRDYTTRHPATLDRALNTLEALFSHD